jgi:hypothetical protein
MILELQLLAWGGGICFVAVLLLVLVATAAVGPSHVTLPPLASPPLPAGSGSRLVVKMCGGRGGYGGCYVKSGFVTYFYYQVSASSYLLA